MSRIEFMNELRALLLELSAEEREEAMQYYNDYFDDAGIENEAAIIAELGSPRKVADTIKAGLAGADDESSEYRETGYRDVRFEYTETPATHEEVKEAQKAEQEEKQNQYQNQYQYHTDEQRYDQGSYHSTGKSGSEKGGPWTSNTLKIILIVLIVLIGAPIVIPVVIGILAAVFGILVAVAAIAAGLLFAGIGIVIAGIACIGAGISQIFYSLPVAFALMGAGLLAVVLGVLLTVLTWWLALKIIPPVFRWFVELCRKPFQKRRNQM